MEFTIFKKAGAAHFDHNGIDDNDGDIGEDINIEIPDERVALDLAEIVYSNYIRCAMPLKAEYEINVKAVIGQIRNFIEDFDLINTLLEEYGDALHDYYEDEYNDGE